MLTLSLFRKKINPPERVFLFFICIFRLHRSARARYTVARRGATGRLAFTAPRERGTPFFPRQASGPYRGNGSAPCRRPVSFFPIQKQNPGIIRGSVSGTGGGARTHTIRDQGILSPRRLPFRHTGMALLYRKGPPLTTGVFDRSVSAASGPGAGAGVEACFNGFTRFLFSPVPAPPRAPSSRRCRSQRLPLRPSPAFHSL